MHRLTLLHSLFILLRQKVSDKSTAFPSHSNLATILSPCYLGCCLYPFQFLAIVMFDFSPSSRSINFSPSSLSIFRCYRVQFFAVVAFDFSPSLRLIFRRRPIRFFAIDLFDFSPSSHSIFQCHLVRFFAVVPFNFSPLSHSIFCCRHIRFCVAFCQLSLLHWNCLTRSSILVLARPLILSRLVHRSLSRLVHFVLA
jgi:hypothetical protein